MSVAPPLRAPREPQRLCSECDNARLGRVVFCAVFNQVVWDEREAQDCPAYDRLRN